MKLNVKGDFWERRYKIYTKSLNRKKSFPKVILNLIFCLSFLLLFFFDLRHCM